MTETKIDKGIPIPPGSRAKKYLFDELEVGDSFFIPKKKLANVGSVKVRWERRLNRKFTTRTVIEDGVKGVRFWRVS